MTKQEEPSSHAPISNTEMLQIDVAKAFDQMPLNELMGLMRELHQIFGGRHNFYYGDASIRHSDRFIANDTYGRITDRRSATKADKAVLAKFTGRDWETATRLAMQYDLLLRHVSAKNSVFTTFTDSIWVLNEGERHSHRDFTYAVECSVRNFIRANGALPTYQELSDKVEELHLKSDHTLGRKRDAQIVDEATYNKLFELGAWTQ